MKSHIPRLQACLKSLRNDFRDKTMEESFRDDVMEGIEDRCPHPTTQVFKR